MAKKSAKQAKKLKREQSPAQSEAARSDADKTVQNLPPQTIDQVRNVPEEGNELAETVKVVNKPNLQVGAGESTAPMKTAEEELKEMKAAEKARGSNKSKAEVEACWNCGENLDADGDCAACGFQKSIMFNQNIEAERERKRQLAERGY